MDDDPSNEAFVLSLIEGYGADETDTMDTVPPPPRGGLEGQVPHLDGRGEIPSDRSEARRIARMAKSFTLVDDKLYKCAASGVLQRCIPIP
jgi:hypothetical protein